MLKVVLARSDALPELEELSDDIFSADTLVGPEYFSRLQKVVKIFLDRNWVL